MVAAADFFPGNRSASGKLASRRDYSARKAFTLIELLVVIAIIAILTAILLPALAKAKTRTLLVRCSNNNRQMMLGWNMYPSDFGDWLLASVTNNPPNAILKEREVWVRGNFDTAGDTGIWDPTVYIDKSPMMPYIGKSRAVWKCPADPVRVKNTAGQMVQRVRVNSMSQVFAYGEWLPGVPVNGVYMCYAKMAQIRKPADTWVLGEEHPDSINDAAMANRMAGNTGDAAPKIIDYPGSFHGGAGTFAMADGHCVNRKWLGSVIKPPVTGNPLPLGNNTPAPDAGTIKDLQWWATITTVRQ